MRIAVLTGWLIVMHAGVADAQRNQATVDASILRGTWGYARQVENRIYAGFEIGFGFPQIDQTLRPKPDSTGSPDFEEYLHLGVFVRFAASEHFEVDVGARASIADLWPCGASDCWPAGFLGVYAQPMVGWRRIKLGPRLVAGRIGETEQSHKTDDTFLVAVNPLTARLSFPW